MGEDIAQVQKRLRALLREAENDADTARTDLQIAQERAKKLRSALDVLATEDLVAVAPPEQPKTVQEAVVEIVNRSAEIVSAQDVHDALKRGGWKPGGVVQVGNALRRAVKRNQIRKVDRARYARLDD